MSTSNLLSTGEEKSSDQIFPFLELPPEIRREIYIHFFTSSTVRLREQMRPRCNVFNKEAHPYLKYKMTRFLRSRGMRNFRKDPRTQLVALFMTCRQSHDEALPLFYQEAYFHWSVRSRFSTELTSFQAQLPSMRHLSIDFSFSITGLEGQVIDELTLAEKLSNTDKEIGRVIRYVVQNCRSLRTFALHLLPDYGLCPDTDAIFSANEPIVGDLGSHTVEAFASLGGKVRDTISIIAVGSEGGYGCLRGAIAPAESWKSSKLRNCWPGITITHDQADCLETILYDNRAIRMYYFVPKSSKVVDTQAPKPIEFLADRIRRPEDFGTDWLYDMLRRVAEGASTSESESDSSDDSDENESGSGDDVDGNESGSGDDVDGNESGSGDNSAEDTDMDSTVSDEGESESESDEHEEMDDPNDKDYKP